MTFSRNFSRKLLIILVLCASLLLANCARTSHTGYTSIPHTHAATEISFVCPVKDNEYWISCFTGMENAGADFHVKANLYGPEAGEDYTLYMQNYLKAEIDKQPDGILLYGGLENLSELINEASRSNIPVVTVDSDAPNTERIAYVGTDSYQAGMLAANAIVNHIEESGKIAVLISSLSAEKELSVVSSLNDFLCDYHIEIVGVFETNLDEAHTRTIIDELLIYCPEVEAVFTTASSNAAFVGQALKERNRTDIYVTGFDDTEENMALLKEGAIDALITQSPEDLGYTGLQVLHEYLEKGRLSKKQYLIPSKIITTEEADLPDSILEADSAV